MTTLLVGHALAEDTPAGAALREAGLAEDLGAAGEANAGRLGSALRGVHLGSHLQVLADAWPASVRAADRRLRRIPSSFVMQVQLVEVLLYLFLIVVLQFAATSVLTAKVGPAFLYGQVGSADEHWFLVELAYELTRVMIPMLLAGLVAAVLLPVLIPRVASPLRRAREAAMAAALVETGAPPEVRRIVAQGFRKGPPPEATVADLDRVFEASLTRSRQAQAQVVASVRTVGLAAVVFTALLTTMGVYLVISQIHLTV